MLDICIAIPDKHKPAQSNNVESHAAFFMFFSTKAPKQDAPVPRKNMFKQNANCTAVFDTPSNCYACSANKLNA